MSDTRSTQKDVKLELYRERLTGRYRWRVRVPGRILADGGQGYSRRIDCLAGACRVLGVDELAITWLEGNPKVYDYGQVRRAAGVVEVIVWKRWWRR